MNQWKELQVSRMSRDRYQFDEMLFGQSGHVIFADYHAVRRFVQRMNEKQNVVDFPEKAIRAGDINGMGLMHEIFHFLIQNYKTQKNAQLFSNVLDKLHDHYGKEKVDELLTTFTDEFPPLKVYKRDLDVEKYLEDSTDGESHREVMLEELMLLWVANNNPAYSNYLDLFDDSTLEKNTDYLKMIDSIREILDDEPGYGPGNVNLLDMLEAPAKAVPNSISGQLEWIQRNWGGMLGKFIYRLLRGLDLIKEEEKMRGLGPGPQRVYEFGGEAADYEAFTQDKDWMPKVVLLAKNAYVWLDQLSKKYGRKIDTLDKIPDEELDTLANRGFTGLWLIGLWERSEASKNVKQMMGNPEAVASAYSLYDYDIANDLGGWEAYTNLRERSRSRGVRLSGDMVPNHVGIDGKWVIEHPDWFVQLDYSPFPSYTFNGPDICQDDRVQIYLEDHYYERSDAAVVFKRVDSHTGNTRYIYHGNDGTSMPWNDTAQLNYLIPEVREAVVQTILHVARNFDIIRFDAAMTLAKKHFQRLWFPEPGTGGDIASRAEHGMTKEQFDEVFPKEFWREVVDRINEEEPDTLLLAEAFWLMEGYFVRTLGMHRVYNSAFMNMMKTEDNAKYRQTIKNVIEFNPEILKRFVNFMNNPDEETAVAQFGKDGKYFGTCIMMATMPGLPMFGHGQVEGLTEKYGMEFKRAYWDETPDENLVQRHEREVFPLLHKRYLFAEVENFQMYDVFTPGGYVNENIFAYSNRSGDERGLVVYNNKYDSAQGWIRTSVAKNENGSIVQKTLGEGLELKNAGDHYTLFRDQISGLEFIRNNHHLINEGLFVELQGFDYQVFLDFRQVQDVDGMYAEIARYLDGRGVPSIDEALQETMLQPIHSASKAFFNKDEFQKLMNSRITTPSDEIMVEDLERIESDIEHFLTEIKDFIDAPNDVKPVINEIKDTVNAILKSPVINKVMDDGSKELRKDIEDTLDQLDEDTSRWVSLFSWAIVRNLGLLTSDKDVPERSRSMIDDLLLGKIMTELYRELGVEEDANYRHVELVKIITAHQNWYEEDMSQPNTAYRVMEKLMRSASVRDFLDIHRHQDVLWFNKETFDELCWWLRMLLIVEYSVDSESPDRLADLEQRNDLVKQFESAEKESDYKVDQLLEALKEREDAVLE